MQHSQVTAFSVASVKVETVKRWIRLTLTHPDGSVQEVDIFPPLGQRFNVREQTIEAESLEIAA